MKCRYPQSKIGLYNGSEFTYVHSCGQCTPCRVNRREEWLCRILMESYSHAESLFVTLTYASESVPLCGTLVKRDVQLFLKRLRKRLVPRKVRHFVCGEYGEKSKRPHYHAVLFGLGLDDYDLVCLSWKNGFVSVSELNRSRARYVAQYIMKKLVSPSDLPDGLAPEFGLMSKKPGLGVTLLQSIIASAKHGGISLDTGLSRENSSRVMLSTLPGSIRLDGKLHRLDPFLKNKLFVAMGAATQNSLRRMLDRHVAEWKGVSTDGGDIRTQDDEKIKNIERKARGRVL